MVNTTNYYRIETKDKIVYLDANCVSQAINDSGFEYRDIVGVWMQNENKDFIHITLLKTLGVI